MSGRLIRLFASPLDKYSFVIFLSLNNPYDASNGKDLDKITYPVYGELSA